jgi:hypothetical protein
MMQRVRLSQFEADKPGEWLDDVVGREEQPKAVKHNREDIESLLRHFAIDFHHRGHYMSDLGMVLHRASDEGEHGCTVHLMIPHWGHRDASPQ